MRYFNPNAFYLMQYARDERKRFLLMYGGSSSAKSYSAAQVLLFLAYTQRENALVMRKIGASINKTIYEDFRLAASQLHLLKAFTFTVNSIRCENGAKIDFCGIDDPEKIKGISNYKRVLLEELSEFEEPDFKQVRIRLRGMSGQQIWATWNPISETHWIKQKLLDQEKWHDMPMRVEIEGFVVPSDYCRVKSVKENAPKVMMNPQTGEMEEQPSNIVLIQSTYLNNFWVVGSPDGTYGFVDKQAIMEFDYNREHDENYYRIYALGEWGILKTGSEFFGSFNSGKHVKRVEYNPALPIHLSVDNNVLPYITCTMWQIEIGERKVVRQFGELMAENPNNTVRRAAKLMAGVLRSLNYAEKVYLHADASTRAANTIDEEKRSFFDLYISTLSEEGFEVVDMAAASNPSVPMSGEFINKIFEGAIDGVEIEIGEGCKVSVNDYLSVQKDVNGGILKTKVKNKMTGQTYEDKGHCCFIASTPIRTARGVIPISEVKIGDFVVTEKGYISVYNSFVSSFNSRVFFVTLNCKRMGVTYDHPVYTSGGFKPIYKLREGDEILIYKNEKLCKERLSCITVSSLTAILIQNMKVIERTIRDGLFSMVCVKSNTFTDTCGSSLMVKFLKAIMYITSMAITTITHLITLLLCLVSNMFLTTARTALLKLRENVKKHCVTPLTKLLHGIVLPKVLHGTHKTQKSRWSEESTRNILASTVARPLRAVLSKGRNFARTIASRHGEDCHTSMMRNVLVEYAELNLLSTGMLLRSAVLRHVPLSLGHRQDVYNISTDSGTYLANDILVHNCDTFRYLVVDVLKSEFIEFSNKRKRNIYAQSGMLNYFNPNAEMRYERSVVYMLPNIDERFVLVEAAKVGEFWNVVDVRFCDVVAGEDMSRELERDAEVFFVECADAYFGWVRDERARTSKDIRVVRMSESGIDGRILSKADDVRRMMRFDFEKGGEYAAFIENMMDYNRNSRDYRQASAAVSGMVEFLKRI